MMGNIYNNIKTYTSTLDNSKYFAGIVMIILNIGSKYITIKLSKTQESYLSSSIARQILIFSIIWMGSRDLLISLILSAVFIILTDHLFNEKSKLCILPESLKEFEEILDENNDGEVTPDELENAKRILEKANRKENFKKQRNQLEGFKNML
jgi:hypothetical protein